MKKTTNTTCPICKKKAAEKYHPFCSNRCAHVDLGKWLGGNYAIPASEEDIPDFDDEYLDQPPQA